MKSSAKFGIDHENKPVLNIYSEWSEDLRDQIAVRFMDRLQNGGINQPTVEIFASGRGNGNFEYTLTPTTPEVTKEEASPSSFFSRWNIGDEADFTTKELCEIARAAAIDTIRIEEKREVSVSEEVEYIPEYKYGNIVAVKFTKAKVYYDICDDYTGKIISDIPSENVKNLSPEFSNRPRPA